MLSLKSLPELLHQQNNCGFYCSANVGAEWQDLTKGLPSGFRFVQGLRTQDSVTINLLPKDRYWVQMWVETNETSQKPSFEYIAAVTMGKTGNRFPQGITSAKHLSALVAGGHGTDDLNPRGIYIGATSGQIINSRDIADN